MPLFLDVEAAPDAALDAELDAALAAEAADELADDVWLAVDEDRAVLPEAAAPVLVAEPVAAAV